MGYHYACVFGLLILATCSVCVRALNCVNGHLNAHSKCVCDAGYEGAHCDIIQHHYCFNGGTYSQHLHRCECLPGYHGTHCLHRHQCHNGGQLVVKTNTCHCTANWTGPTCEIIICQHGHRDTHHQNLCHCHDGYTGTYCEHVRLGHCLNGGLYDQANHKCLCTNGHYGSHCQNELQCFHGGTLHRATNSCQCTRGWTGLACERIVCFNGHPNILHNKCNCNQGFSGLHCSRRTSDLSTSAPIITDTPRTIIVTKLVPTIIYITPTNAPTTTSIDNGLLD